MIRRCETRDQRAVTAFAPRAVLSKRALFRAALLFGLSALAEVRAKPTGFFHLSSVEGRWWLVSPTGELCISKGVCNVNYAPDAIKDTNRSPYRENCAEKYGSDSAWRAIAGQRLRQWNFNSIGAWSDSGLSRERVEHGGLARAPVLNLGANFAREQNRNRPESSHAWLHGVFPDVFDPAFERSLRRQVRRACAAHTQDPWVLGWFTDNELRWGPDWRDPDELLVSFLKAPADSAGRTAAMAFLRQRYAAIADFNRVWKTTFQNWPELSATTTIESPFPRQAVYQQNAEVERELNRADPNRSQFVADCDAFLGIAAERYFELTAKAVRAVAPHHLVFGCRFAYVPAPPVIEAAARWLDVISFNRYDRDPAAAIARYAVFGKPLLIGEFSFRAADSGLPNKHGVGPIVRNQQERGEAFRVYVQKAMASPLVVGYHWFEHADQPAEGRFDGEDSNYGLVNIHDDPYAEFVRVVTEVNASAEQWHRCAPVGSDAKTKGAAHAQP